MICARPPETVAWPHPAYAELHCHSHFSFLDGASAPDDLVARAVELGPAGARHHRPPGPVRRGPVLDRGGGRRPAPGDRDRDRAARRRRSRTRAGIVVPGAAAPWRPGRRPPVRRGAAALVADGRPGPPAPRARPAARPSRGSSRRTTGGSARRSAGRTSCCSRGTRRAGGACAGWCRGRTSPGRRPCPRFTQALLAEHARGAGRAVRAAATASSRGGCGPAIARGPGRWPSGTRRCSAAAESAAGVGLRARAVAPPPPRRRLARLGDRAPGRRAGAAGRRHQRRPLRAARRAASSRTS